MKFHHPLHLHMASLVTTSNDNSVKPSTHRSFQFVEYGTTIPPHDSVIISCDGRIDGVTMELTHWNGNETPEQFYADTSTEMALNFCHDNLLNEDFSKDLIVANNHFDTDGVLSVFACLQPEWIQSNEDYHQLLMDGAAAGDFGEWSSDSGVKLDAILEGICQEQNSDEARAYEVCLKELPNILHNILHEGGAMYENYWKTTLDHARASYDAIQSGQSTFETTKSSFGQASDSVIVSVEPFALSPFALHRGLVEHNLWPKAQRILRVIENKSDNGNAPVLLNFWYEKPGHGWVQKLRDRPVIRPSPKAVGPLLESLNQVTRDVYQNAETARAVEWTNQGGRSLVSICQTTRPLVLDESDHARKRDEITREFVDVLAKMDAPPAQYCNC